MLVKPATVFEFKSHYPARGRKLTMTPAPSPGPGAFKSHYPARGRKQGPYYSRCKYSNVQIPLPRKGTETRRRARPDREYRKVQIPLPRKGTETLLAPLDQFQSEEFKSHYPARGRKLVRRSGYGRLSNSGSNPITPQGDGNEPLWNI